MASKIMNVPTLYHTKDVNTGLSFCLLMSKNIVGLWEMPLKYLLSTEVGHPHTYTTLITGGISV